MEKRRRARINASLAELKSLLLEAIKKEGARHNKMEKADILEMAVKHLRQIQRQQFTGEPMNDSSLVNKYRLGFHACAQEVSKYLGTNNDEDVELKTKLLNHLANCMTSGLFETMSSSASPSSLMSSPSSSTTVPIPLSPLSLGTLSPSSTTLSSDAQNNNISGSGSGQSSTGMIKKDPSIVKVTVSEMKPEGLGMTRVAETETDSGGLSERMIRATQTYAANFISTTQAVNSVLIKPKTASSPSNNFQRSEQSSMHRDDKDEDGNNDNSNDRPHNAQVSEVNNNTITLPTFINLAGSTTLASLQHQQQHGSHLQQHAQLQHPTLGHHYPNQQDLLQQQQQENTNLVANLNRLQLIPTKAVNGETVFVLSANLVNPAQFPNYTIPVLTPPIVNQTQVLAPSLPQQAIQIAVSCPQEERPQPLAFLQHIAQPQLQVAALKTDQVLVSTHSTTSHQATPLNLSSTSNQSPKRLNAPITNHSSARTFNSNFVPESSNHEVVSSLAITASAAPYHALHYTPCTTDPTRSSHEHTGLLSQYHSSAALPISNGGVFTEFPASVSSASAVAIVKPQFNDLDRGLDDSRQKSHLAIAERSKEEPIRSSFHTSGEQLPAEADTTNRQPSFFRPW